MGQIIYYEYCINMIYNINNVILAHITYDMNEMFQYLRYRVQNVTDRFSAVL